MTKFVVIVLKKKCVVIVRRNYNVGPLSLPHERNWSLKFQASTISPLSFKIELYWSFY